MPYRLATSQHYNSGSDLLSHKAAPAVQSALEDLTAVFEMRTGVTPPQLPPEDIKLKDCTFKIAKIDYISRLSPRPISIGQLRMLPLLHLRPIDLIVYQGSY